ncbi:MAG TPA: hypothetical protein DD641_00325 [Deltaproteobacteria bacterium]|nr:hypothetical protein [Deltaproteobacteria bacterium]
MKTLEPVQGNDISVQLATMQTRLDLILREVRALRLERLPADPELIEILLATIYAIFDDDEFTSFFIFDECSGNNKNSVRLRAVISGCLRGELTIRRLSFFLSKICGNYGVYTLIYCGKQREGHYYKVTR